VQCGREIMRTAAKLLHSITSSAREQWSAAQ
jgi:hypothetical protein